MAFIIRYRSRKRSDMLLQPDDLLLLTGPWPSIYGYGK